MSLITLTNFDVAAGPTGQTSWALNPPPAPKPDVDRVLANKPDENWVPFIVESEVMAGANRVSAMYPRRGFAADGVADVWVRHSNGEALRGIHFPSLADMMASMPETILRDNSMTDGHLALKQALKIEAKNPGTPAVIRQTWEDALKAKTMEATGTLDLEFKRRLPKEGLRMAHVRQVVKKLQEGRMDSESIIRDENEELVAVGRQIVFVLDSQRKFKKSASSEKANL